MRHFWVRSVPNRDSESIGHGFWIQHASYLRLAGPLAAVHGRQGHC